jgi:hypothetical protein
MTQLFDCYVGIDWSGDKRNWQKGLKVAVADPGRSAPRLEFCPVHNGKWSRTEAMKWIEQQVRHKRILIGLDFAFGFPTVELADDVTLDWEYVEQLCKKHLNFYGGAFFRASNGAHSHLVNSPWLPKHSYSAHHLRVTDRVAKETPGATPQSIFNAVGPAQVGPSSISGMRALRNLRMSCGEHFDIWPFSEVSYAKSVIVEIFPRFFALHRKCSPKLKDHFNLNAALAAYDSEPVKLAPKSEDEGDALLSAAALRKLSSQETLFELPDQSIRSQGWIFGVPVYNGKTS